MPLLHAERAAESLHILEDVYTHPFTNTDRKIHVQLDMKHQHDLRTVGGNNELYKGSNGCRSYLAVKSLLLGITWIIAPPPTHLQDCIHSTSMHLHSTCLVGRQVYSKGISQTQEAE